MGYDYVNAYNNGGNYIQRKKQQQQQQQQPAQAQNGKTAVSGADSKGAATSTTTSTASSTAAASTAATEQRYKKMSVGEKLSGQHDLAGAEAMSYRRASGNDFLATKVDGTTDTFELQGDSKLASSLGSGSRQAGSDWGEPQRVNLAQADAKKQYRAKSFITRAEDGTTTSVADEQQYHTNFVLKDGDGGMKVYEADTKNASTAEDAKQQRQDAVIALPELTVHRIQQRSGFLDRQVFW